MNRTAFILNNAMKAAQEVILDQALPQMPPEQRDAFVAALDAPPTPHFDRFMDAPWCGTP
ncbi:MAG: DUF1778 domain-containing protein [Desulfosarcina sp.]|nr:DUF1778 domain-containing protein [Desulfobacterales bacterium]